MRNTNSLINLNSFLSTCSDEDYAWILHIYNAFENNQNSLELDIETLNNITHLKDIKKIIINCCHNFNEKDIDDFLYKLKCFKQDINISIDLKEIKNNQRFLNFVSESLLNELRNHSLKSIKNIYHRIVYMIYTYPEISYSRFLSRIESNFSKTLTKHPLHFKNYDNLDFYIWAKNYMDENRSYKSYHYKPTKDIQYKDVVTLVFDMLYIQDELVYEALKKKLANAWYQKKYRKENKGKKEHYYLLPSRTKESLKILSMKLNLEEEKVIENLINQAYVKNCMNHNGQEIYKD